MPPQGGARTRALAAPALLTLKQALCCHAQGLLHLCDSKTAADISKARLQCQKDFAACKSGHAVWRSPVCGTDTISAMSAPYVAQCAAEQYQPGSQRATAHDSTLQRIAWLCCSGEEFGGAKEPYS